jgi:hypothetical protein
VTTQWTPMRWPAVWKDPTALDLLKETAINCLLIENPDNLRLVAARAQQEGLKVAAAAFPPTGVTLVKGEWPGVKLTESGAVDRASAGPTGAPWVDSNGWKIRLAAALHPRTEIWVEAAPQKPRLYGESYLIGVADAAAQGGRWIISLDNELAAGIAGRKADALRTWQKLTGAAAFFAARTGWSDFLPEAVLGIISDFSGKNEFMSHELLNLVARTNQQYRIIPKYEAAASSFSGLKAVLYPDEEPPAPDLRNRILSFVAAGGMLITGPKWGQPPGEPAAGYEHPRYALRALGAGRAAIARPDFEDPYLVANDSAVLISHRYELLRFWNVGAVGSYFTMLPDRKRAVIQILFYAAAYFGNPTVRVAGRYRTARLWTLDQKESRAVEMESQGDATELHLPAVSQYAGVELEL